MLLHLAFRSAVVSRSSPGQRAVILCRQFLCHSIARCESELMIVRGIKNSFYYQHRSESCLVSLCIVSHPNLPIKVVFINGIRHLWDAPNTRLFCHLIVMFRYSRWCCLTTISFDDDFQGFPRAGCCTLLLNN